MNTEGILGPRGFLHHANLEGNKKTFSVTLTDQEYETIEEYQRLSDRSRNSTIRALLAYYFRGYIPTWPAERDLIQSIRDAWRKEHPDQGENRESKPVRKNLFLEAQEQLREVMNQVSPIIERENDPHKIIPDLLSCICEIGWLSDKYPDAIWTGSINKSASRNGKIKGIKSEGNVYFFPVEGKGGGR